MAKRIKAFTLTHSCSLWAGGSNPPLSGRALVKRWARSTRSLVGGWLKDAENIGVGGGNIRFVGFNHLWDGDQCVYGQIRKEVVLRR